MKGANSIYQEFPTDNINLSGLKRPIKNNAANSVDLDQPAPNIKHEIIKPKQNIQQK